MTEFNAPPRAARILIVDDSAVMRSLLRTVVSSDARLEVVGTASDGASAIRALESCHPDLVLLDVEMPVMDGLSTLKQMKARGSQTPVIMCSSLTQRGAKVTIEALASGAADYVAKPSGQPSRESAVQALIQELIPKIFALTASRVSSAAGSVRQVIAPMRGQSIFSRGTPAQAGLGGLRSFPFVPPTSAAISSAPSFVPLSFTPSLVVIGVSTGGPAALDVLLPALPASFPLPVLIVQHMPEMFTRMLAERLDSRCPMPVSEATHGEPVCPGHIYIARGNWHFEITASPMYQERGFAPPPNPAVRLTQKALENHCRPAVDVLFRSAVSCYGRGVLGVILTGMGSDGLAGCRLIREHEGAVIAQDEPSSAVWGMPGAVSQAGLAHRILPLNVIAPEILRLAARSQREVAAGRESALRESAV